MTRKKGGGRESGESQERRSVPESVAEAQARAKLPAADPAACYCYRLNKSKWDYLVGQTQHERDLHDRIRELEAGGGRESGGGGTPLSSRSLTEQTASAAANPAAFSVGEHDCPKECHERIRDLEDAERTCKIANESQRKTIAELEAELAEAEDALAGNRSSLLLDRAERAEADFAQLKELPPKACPKCGDVQHSGPCREFNPDDPEDWDELPKAVRERAERAEARVKVLEKHHRDAHTDFEHPQSCWAELRGEDRG